MITREKFIQAIKAFEAQHGVLGQSLQRPEKPVPTGKSDDESSNAAYEKWDEDQARHKHLTRLFFSDPVIHGYLTRKEVRFEDGHPLLIDAKDTSEQDTTDYYELQIYRLYPFLISWRNEQVASKAFSAEGGSLIQDGDAFFHLLQQNQKNTHTQVHAPQDIYRIANNFQVSDIRSMIKGSASKGTPWLHLYPNWKDAHATSVVSITDPASGRVLLCLFINSWSNEGYDTYMKNRLLAGQPFRASYQLSDFHIVGSKAPTMLDRYLMKAFHVDKKALSDEEWQSGEGNDVGFSRLNGDDYFALYQRKNIPFVSANFGLQQSDSDCTLYGLNFLNGIAKMLDDPGIAERILKLSREVANKVPGAEEALREIFNDYLKRHLPMYFDPATGKQKSAEEIMSYHLQQRWDIGSVALDLKYPVAVSFASSGPNFFAEQEPKKGADKKGPDPDPSCCTIS